MSYYNEDILKGESTRKIALSDQVDQYKFRTILPSSSDINSDEVVLLVSVIDSESGVANLTSTVKLK